MTVSVAARQFVRDRAGGLCEYCHADERWQFVRFTIDHVVPQSAGGTDDLENLALACRNCNERRGNRCEAPDSLTMETVAVFNPRTELWSDHFAWMSDRVRIAGLTSIGRGTIALLDMNDERRNHLVLRIRQRDADDGFHPPPNDLVLSDDRSSAIE